MGEVSANLNTAVEALPRPLGFRHCSCESRRPGFLLARRAATILDRFSNPSRYSPGESKMPTTLERVLQQNELSMHDYSVSLSTKSHRSHQTRPEKAAARRA